MIRPPTRSGPPPDDHRRARAAGAPPGRSLRKRAGVLFVAIVPVLGALVAARPLRSQVGRPPELHMSMGHHVVEWAAEPGDVFTVRVTNSSAVTSRLPDGEKAFVDAYADADGRVRVTLRFRTNDFAYAYVEPGDRFEVSVREGPLLVDFVVPDFRVDVDDEGRRVAGYAPAGRPITVTLEPDIVAAPFERVVVAGADGRFAIDLPDGSRLAEGEGGRAVLVGDGGQWYTAVFARRRVEVMVDSARIETRASQQSPIRAERVVVDGERTRVRGFSVNTPPQEGISPDGRRLLTDDYPHLLRAGDRVTITQVGGGMDRDDRWPRTVPDLRVRLDRDRILGEAPPGERVEVRLLDAGSAGARLAETVTADAAGRFEVVLSAEMAPSAGWRAVARVDSGDGIWMRADAVIPRLEAAVNAAHVGVDALPFQPVTLTLRTPDGTVVASGAHRTDQDGRLDAHFDTGRDDRDTGWDILALMRTGDLLEVELVAGDPWLLVVPRLTGRIDLDAERIHGRADPYRQIAIDVVQEDEEPRRFDVTAGSDGLWQLDLPGVADLEPDRFARVEAAVDGHRFYLYTAPLVLSLHEGRSYVGASPYMGYSTAITLTTADGRVAGSATRIAERLEPPLPVEHPMWHLDVFGGGVRIRPGDRLTWRTGFDTASLVMQPLEARAHIVDDLVVVRTVAGGRLRIETAPLDPSNRVFELEADARGIFSHRFDDFDLQYNSNLSITLEQGRHRIIKFLELPGLALDLSNGMLTGHLEPSLGVRARVGEEGLTSATGSGRTDAHAAFALYLGTSSDRVPTWSPGESLVLDAPEAELTEQIDWRVPLLEIEPEGDFSVRGRVEPGSQLRVRRSMSQLNRGASSTTVRPAPDAEGRWSATFDRPPLAPGAISRVDAVLPDGHIAMHRHVEPMLVARYGTDQVCGVGMPDAEVRVSSRDAGGRLLASADGRVSRAGTFDLRLAPVDPDDPDDPDEGAVIREGQRVEAVVQGKSIGFDVGPMDLEVDVAGGRIVGRVLPDAPLIIESPIRTCLRAGVYSEEVYGRIEDRVSTYYVSSGAGGEIDRTIKMTAIDYGVDVTVFTPEGHAYLGSAFPRPSVTAWVDENRISGLVRPGAEVEARLLDDVGEWRADGRARAGADAGRFEIRLFDATGAPVVIRPGDRVELLADGGLAEMEVERLGFDFDPTRELTVRAPADRRLELRFVHPTGEQRLAARSDDAGRYAFTAADVPARAGWTLADLRALDVVLPRTPGMATGSAYRAPDEGGGGRVWLPVVGVGE